MGVIRKSDPKLGIFASDSEESLHIPQYSEDDDDASGSAEIVSLSTVVRVPHRQHHRLRPMPMSFSSPRKRIGKKRVRRYENGHHLETLLEDDEFPEISIYDFVPDTCVRFSRLMENQDAQEFWDNFINSSEEVQQQFASSSRQNQLKIEMPHQRNLSRTGEEAFKNITSGLRSKLKKSSMPLGMIDHLERKVVEFFTTLPAQIFISEHLTSFERLMLHAVAQYHCLVSFSFDSGPEKTRLVRVSNPFGTFEEPRVLLVQFLDEKRKKSVLN